jgi:hypothetical protein
MAAPLVAGLLKVGASMGGRALGAKAAGSVTGTVARAGLSGFAQGVQQAPSLNECFGEDCNNSRV